MTKSPKDTKEKKHIHFWGYDPKTKLYPCEAKDCKVIGEGYYLGKVFKIKPL